MRVLKKQNISNMCIVCGVINPGGIRAKFYEMENGELCCLFTPREHHQSYPGRLHGGVSSAIIDEAIGRAIQITEPDSWAVTVDLHIRYKQPVPLHTPLRAVARVTKNSRRMYEGEGEILLPDGTIAVSGHATYIKLSGEKIASDADFFENVWREEMLDTDPAEIDLP